MSEPSPVQGPAARSARGPWRWAVPTVIVLVIWSLTTHGKFSHAGDEPHYLIVAESLVSDGDLDLANNYRNGDGRWFGADDLQAGPHARLTRRGALWSVHDIGVPVTLLPVYVVATRAALLLPDSALTAMRQTRGLFAYSLVSVFLIGLTAWGASLVYSGLRRLVPDGRAAAVAMVMALSPPILGHAFLVFPETLATVVVCAVVWLLCQSTDDLTPVSVAVILLAVGFLPWLHRKYSALELGLAVLLVVHHWSWFRRRGRTFLAYTAGAVTLPQAGLYLWTFAAWGSVAGPQLQTDFPFTLGGLARGALGLVLDRERGLLAYAPIALLVPACVALTWRSSRWLVGVAALLYLPMAAFTVWAAGFSPAARYLVPLVPLATIPVAVALGRRAVRSVAIPLLAVQAAVVAVLWQNPRLLWPQELGENLALQHIPIVGPAWERLLPSLWTGDPLLRALPASVFVAVLTLVLWWAASRSVGVDAAASDRNAGVVP